MSQTKWSLYQSTIFSTVQATDGNYQIAAVAGSGKSSTVLELIRQMVSADPDLKVLLGAFSAKIKVELTGKIASMDIGDRVDVKTFHALGFGIIRAYNGKDVKTELTTRSGDLKIQRITDAMVEKRPDLVPFIKFIEKAVAMAKRVGFGLADVCAIDDINAWGEMITNYGIDIELGEDVEGRLEKAIAASIWVLKESNKDTKVVDFDDMTYLPLLYNMKFPRWSRFGLVVIDECQDLNMTRLLLAERAVAPGGRVVAVGDQHQSIFTFTGAMLDSMKLIANRFNCRTLPLSVNYRCSKAVIREAQQYVSHITAHDDAIEGAVKHIGGDEFDTQDFGDDDAIICRNNAPLVPAAFRLIRKGVPCRIEGKEIGVGLVTFTKRWKSVKTIPALRAKINAWKISETNKAKVNKNDHREAFVADQADTVIALIDAAEAKSLDLNGMRAMITEMFGDSFDDNGKPAKKMLTLCTYHKSKGLEFRGVYLLDHAKLCPSKYAIQDWARKTERNLAYVAVTRSKDTLFYVDLDRNSLKKVDAPKTDDTVVPFKTVAQAA